MTNYKLEKIYSVLIIFFFFISYILYSFLEPPIYTLSQTPGDTFYYFVYGREAADLRFFSWNGLYPSNGFHPLWLVFVSLSFLISQNLDIVIYLLSIFLFVFFIISLWCFYRINQIYNDKLVQIISTFLFTILATKYFFWYMESALSVVLFLGYIYYVIFKFILKDKKNILISLNIGIISSLIALSRLDLVLLISPLHGYLIFCSILQRNIKASLALALPPILIVGGYVILIYLITGSPVPLSGVIKSNFPNIIQNVDWSMLLSNQIKYGILAVAITLICAIGTSIITRFIKKKLILFKLKTYLNIIYFLLIGIFLHTLYCVTFSDIGSVGRWYFIVHLNVSILSISLFLYYLKIFFETNFFNNYIFKKTVLYSTIIITLPIIFYNSIYLRKSIEYKYDTPYGRMEYEKKEPYAVMKFVEMLDKKKFDKSTKIFDGTDGNFAFFSKIPTYHIKGMAATPQYVHERKKILKRFRNDKKTLNDVLNKFEKKFFLEKKIEYILMNQASKIHYSRNFKTDAENDILEKCIKDISEYNMIGSDEEFITYFYLIKIETYLKNTNVCRGI
jgi:hypothetical protein